MQASRKIVSKTVKSDRWRERNELMTLTNLDAIALAEVTTFVTEMNNYGRSLL